MTRKLRAIIIDDDQPAAMLLRRRLTARFPDLEVSTADSPVDLKPQDIFLIDNDFDGLCLGPALGRELRRQNPDSLIVAISGTLSLESLKGMMNAGCNGAFEKASDDDFEHLLQMVHGYIDRFQTQRKGIRGALLSMADLLRLWNNRLEKLERE